jgi:hypothetical protein
VSRVRAERDRPGVVACTLARAARPPRRDGPPRLRWSDHRREPHRLGLSARTARAGDEGGRGRRHGPGEYRRLPRTGKRYLSGDFSKTNRVFIYSVSW